MVSKKMLYINAEHNFVNTFIYNYASAINAINHVYI